MIEIVPGFSSCFGTIRNGRQNRRGCGISQQGLRNIDIDEISKPSLLW